jgi:hypothetical protein
MSRWISLPRAAWGAVLAAAILGACSAPTLAELGSFTCAAEYQCPNGFTCNRDTKKCGLTEPGSPDASDATVGASDASDAAPEADATVDASDANDATTDATDARDASVDADATADASDATTDANDASDASADADAADAKGTDANDGGPPDTGPGVIQMASLSDMGVQGTQPIVGSPSITENGYSVAFSSASVLIPQDSNAVADVYVGHWFGGSAAMLLVSKDNSSTPTLWNGATTQPVLSGDGNYVAFHTLASGGGAQPGCILRDVNGNTNWQLSTSTSCIPYAVSSDGRYTLFSEPVSSVTTLKRFDRTSSSSLTITNLGGPASASMSSDGVTVAFLSTHPFNSGDTNNRADLYMVDLPALSTFQLASTKNDGTPLPNGATGGGVAGGHSGPWFTTIDQAVPGDTDSDADVYFMAQGGAFITLASGNANGAAGLASISDDGRYLAYEFTPQGGNKEVWVYDNVNKTTASAHKTYNGGTPNGSTERPAISGDGTAIAFVSSASNLVANDKNGTSDVFVLPRP